MWVELTRGNLRGEDFLLQPQKKSLNSVYMCVQISNVTKLTRSCTTLMNTFKISEPEVHIRRVRVHLYSLFVNLIRVSYVFCDKEIKHPCDLGIRVYIFGSFYFSVII